MNLKLSPDIYFAYVIIGYYSYLKFCPVIMCTLPLTCRGFEDGSKFICIFRNALFNYSAIIRVVEPEKGVHGAIGEVLFVGCHISS